MKARIHGLTNDVLASMAQMEVFRPRSTDAIDRGPPFETAAQRHDGRRFVCYPAREAQTHDRQGNQIIKVSAKGRAQSIRAAQAWPGIRSGDFSILQTFAKWAMDFQRSWFVNDASFSRRQRGRREAGHRKGGSRRCRCFHLRRF
jgi:hypothetical protein